MLQRKEIGKKRSKKSIIEAHLNKVYITPKNDQYRLIKHEGKKYTYEWVNCPNEVKNGVTNRFIVNDLIGCEIAMKCIAEIKLAYNLIQ